MKVLFVVHQFLPRHLAGTEVYTHSLARSLKDRGHEVSIYTREYGFFDEALRDENTHYDGLNIKTVYFNSPNRRLKWLRKFYNDFYNPLLERHFKKHINKTNPDIIHVQHLHGLSASFINAARKNRIPSVVTLNDYWFMCGTNQLLTKSLKICSGPFYGLKCPKCLMPTSNRLVLSALYPIHSVLIFIRMMYLKSLLNKVNLIIAPSFFLKDKFLDYGISESKIIFSDYGFNSGHMTHFEAKTGNTLRFTFIGSIMPHKGVHVLIDAFNRLANKNAELKVYGDSGYAPDYFETLKAISTNQHIKFMGHFENNRVYEILAATDVLVVPSIWYENSPLTIHEAALAEVPVITSNIGGMAELVERFQNGLLFEVGIADDLYKKMKLLIDNRRLIKKLKGNPNAIKTIDENAKEIEVIYTRLIDKDRSR